MTPRDVGWLLQAPKFDEAILVGGVRREERTNENTARARARAVFVRVAAEHLLRAHVTNVTTEIERRCQVHLGPRLGATLPGLTGNGETLALAPLFYATGGYAGTCYRSKQSGDNGRFRTTVNNPDVSESDFISGWFVGAGVDIPTSGFIPGTFVQIEYSHAEYGDMTFRLAGSDTTGRLDNNANEIRVGFKYRFPDPTPTPLPVPR